ncbi:hypothetical protein lerEdw1_010882 [Lerista edwardsae]|nr:hypothetical protein lerEdw1_010882 [Lerista edwardsae]
MEPLLTERYGLGGQKVPPAQPASERGEVAAGRRWERQGGCEDLIRGGSAYQNKKKKLSRHLLEAGGACEEQLVQGVECAEQGGDLLVRKDRLDSGSWKLDFECEPDHEDPGDLRERRIGGQSSWLFGLQFWQEEFRPEAHRPITRLGGHAVDSPCPFSKGALGESVFGCLELASHPICLPGSTGAASTSSRGSGCAGETKRSSRNVDRRKHSLLSPGEADTLDSGPDVQGALLASTALAKAPSGGLWSALRKWSPEKPVGETPRLLQQGSHGREEAAPRTAVAEVLLLLLHSWDA